MGSSLDFWLGGALYQQSRWDYTHERVFSSIDMPGLRGTDNPLFHTLDKDM